MVVLALPGAFTPTCSSNHLPCYEELHAELVAQGVDQTVCLSVNDVFVMFQWSKHLGTKNIFMLPDGNGEFTREMVILVKKSSLRFGLHSWRYLMLVHACNLEKMLVEPGFSDNANGDPFEASDADTMLAYIKGVQPTGISPQRREFEG